MADVKLEAPEVLFAVEGERKPLAVALPAGANPALALKILNEKFARTDLVELVLEDEDEPLGVDADLRAALKGEFKLIHAATAGLIDVHVVFNGVEHNRDFRPAATMEKIVIWAMRAFKLEGDPCDFQLKLGEEILAPNEHLGQVAGKKKRIKLALVMRIKPQG